MDLNEAYARIDHILPLLPGWCSPEKGKRLARLIVESRASICVELGVFGGRSLVALGLGLAASTDSPPRHVYVKKCAYGIDPFTRDAALEGTNAEENDAWWSGIDYESIMRTAAAAVEDNGLGPYVQIIRAKSLDVVGRYESIDVMHQDSNHSEEISCAEVDAYAPRIAEGGHWVIDDVNWSSTKSAQTLLRSRGFSLIEEYESWAIYRRDHA